MRRRSGSEKNGRFRDGHDVEFDRVGGVVGSPESFHFFEHRHTSLATMKHNSQRVGTISALALGTIVSMLSIGLGQPPILEVDLATHRERGLPILWNDTEALLLQSNGSILTLKTPEVRDHRVTEEPFVPAQMMALRGDLQREFGRSYEVEAVHSYLIVAPHGQAKVWGQRFAQLHAAYAQYFVTRGLAIRSPDFPLIAVVFHTAQDFHRNAVRDGVSTGPGTLGYYSAITNRMTLYDHPAPASSWFNTDTVILHEATHQLAFNTGVHQRLSDTPLWVAEGLASVFESPGRVHTNERNRSLERVNAARMQTWRELGNNPSQRNQMIQMLIEGNELFKQKSDEAYSISWALSFYLAERDPSRYVQFIRHIAKLPPNQVYSRPDRRRDFEQGISSDVALLAKNVDRFLQEIDP